MPAAAEILRVRLVLGDDEDLGMAGHRLDELMHVEGAEATAEPKMLLRGQVLVAEEDHAMVEQRLMQVGSGRVVEILRQIDTFDNGAEGAADRLHADRLVRHSGFLLIEILSPA